MQTGHLNPACLPNGTQVGPWRVVDWRGRGACGAVYLAEGLEAQASGPVALKLALSSREDRFGREVELLSRIRHPAVPRLFGHGQWRSPAGEVFPYVAMEFVDGLLLYEWGRVHAPSSRQVLRVLAVLARALEATHAVGAVHRDVKGDNVLVRRTDGQVFLMDFGAGTYRDAATLTWRLFPPGTPAYRAPEAFRHALPPRKLPIRSYAPGPADDVFALGVTAYRLVTEQYPPMADPLDPGFHVWDAKKGKGPVSARELNVRCAPELSAFISRMLSLHPEARGSARELARALEQAAQRAGPEADEPLFPLQPPRPVDAEAPPQSLPTRAPHQNWRSWLAAGMAGSVALGAAWVLSMLGREVAEQVRVAEHEEARDAGTVAVGDSVLTATVASTHVPSAWSAITLDLPSKPLQGQIRPDANGRCPRGTQIPINGGCWIKMEGDHKDCPQDGYVYRGGCYEPAFPPPRPATSDPMESRDGGG